MLMNDNDPNVQPQSLNTQNQTNNATFQTLMPTQNKPALIGYYFGVFGLIPFLGIPLAITAVVLGAMGLKQFKRNPTPGAKGHAITALILGIFEIVCFISFFVFTAIASNA